MNWFKRLLFAAIGLSIAQTLQAQQHYNTWFRSTLSIPIGEKFKIDNEFQHRRQNGLENVNLFDKNLMFTYRSWVHYQHKEDIKFSVSPFAYFSHYRIIQNKTDESATPNNEIRFSAAVELQHEIFKKFYIIDRNTLEYRIFSNSQSDITRLRARFGVRYEFTEHIKLTAYDELFLNVAGTPIEHVFDHDRIGLNLEYHLFPNLKFDIGYIHLTRLPLIPVTGNTKLKENNIILNLTYQLHKQTRTTKVNPIG